MIRLARIIFISLTEYVEGHDCLEPKTIVALNEVSVYIRNTWELDFSANVYSTHLVYFSSYRGKL